MQHQLQIHFLQPKRFDSSNCQCAHRFVVSLHHKGIGIKLASVHLCYRQTFGSWWQFQCLWFHANKIESLGLVFWSAQVPCSSSQAYQLRQKYNIDHIFVLKFLTFSFLKNLIFEAESLCFELPPEITVGKEYLFWSKWPNMDERVERILDGRNFHYVFDFDLFSVIISEWI